MFDMEMLNDALNMPLPLFSTGKGRGNRPSAPPRDYYRYQEKEGPPSLYLSSSSSPILLFEQCLFKQNERSHRSNVNPTSSSEPVDRLPVRIDSGAMRCRTFSATPPAILPIILHPPCYLLPPCFLITRSFRIGYN